MAGQSLRQQYAEITHPRLARAAAATNEEVPLGDLRVRLQAGRIAVTGRLSGGYRTIVFMGTGNAGFQTSSAAGSGQWRLFSGSAEPFIRVTAAILEVRDSSPLIRSISAEPPGPAVPLKPFQSLLDERSKIWRADAWLAPVRMLESVRESETAGDEPFFGELRLESGRWLDVDSDPAAQIRLRVHQRTARTEREGVWSTALGPGTYDRATGGGAPPSPTRARINSSGPSDPTAVGGEIDTGYDDIWLEDRIASSSDSSADWKISESDLDVERSGSKLTVSASVAAEAPHPRSGILLALDSRFRISQARLDGGTPLEWIQPDEPATAQFEGNWLYLALPSARTQVRFTLTYNRGVPGDIKPIDILYEELWYPRVLLGPPLQPATYRLRYSSHLSSVERALLPPAQLWSNIPSNLPQSGAAPPRGLPVAGAALLTEPQDVFTTPGAISVKMFTDTTSAGRLARDQLLNAFLFLQQIGPYPLSELKVTDSPSGSRYDPVSGRPLFRPDWIPSNIPARAFESSLMPGRLGRDAPSWPGMLIVDTRWPVQGQCADCGYRITEAAKRQLSFVTIPHVVAHQWWGNQVGWSTEDDAWLPEALANGSAWWFDRETYGTAVADAILNDWQRELGGADAFNRIPDQLGPLAIGSRLCSSLDPMGFDEVAFDKGGYVIEMLYAMMLDSSRGSPDDGGRDANPRFTALLRDFYTEWRGRNPGAADFQAAAQRHMTPAMDLVGDHSLNWFFREYVYSTGIAHLRATTTVTPVAAGFRVEVAVDNPQSWIGLLPVYAMENPQHGQRALVPVRGPKARAAFTVSFRPESVAVDPHHEMLVVLDPPIK